MMRLYNTLTRREEPFAPASDNTVRMYTCGLTVYARGHIGNFRTFVCLDVLRRTLKYLLGYDVRQVMNFTDVDDRTIAGAQKAGKDLRTYTDEYIAAFREDARAMGLEAVEEMPRATDEVNVRAMADLIASLTKNGHTYVSEGSIYFKISTMPRYGQLAHLDPDGIRAGARVDADSYAKEDARDFVLWKASKPGEPAWNIVDPPGRPGWHLECSAMALRLLGEPPIDIHAGGIDLIFPHHENEIAQSEGATGKQFSRFWVHVEYLQVEEQKMSKSLGNTYTIPDVLARGYRASAVRYLLLSAHYRKQLNFTWEGLAQEEAALGRLTDFLARLDTIARPGRRDARRSQHRRGPRRHVRSRQSAQFDDRRRRDGARRCARRARGVRWIRSRARGAEPPPGRGRTAARPHRRDRAAAPRSPQRASPPRFCCGRSYSRRPRGARRPARGRRRRHALEKEMKVQF
jgi:cysteinyl-tRNA synthetase